MNKPPVLILCGGLGTRLGELTATTPKPLVEVAGTPFLLHILSSLLEQGFSDITLLLKHMPEKFSEVPWVNLCKQHIAAQNDSVSWEIHEASKHMDSFWVLNGDTYIKEALPDNDRPIILTNNEGVSAGALFHIKGRLDWGTKAGYEFLDMGTPRGLQEMEDYLANR